MGKDNMTLLIVGLVAIGGVGAFYFMKKREEDEGGGIPEDDGSLANRCWVINPSTRQLGCACGGQQWFALGKGENCSDCEAHCRGQIKTKIGPFDTCSKKQKCNCAACCARNDCWRRKESMRCPCAQVRLGLQQKLAQTLEAEEDIYSYYSSIDYEPPVIIA